jgi:hypothetical protein
MTKKGLEGIKRELASLYGNQRKSRELQNLAKRLGRSPAKRGAYTWKSDAFPHLSPLSIPVHSKGIKKLTAANILDQLDAQDVAAWDEYFQAGGR